ncbi:hypothetical protein Esti_000990 [Eimeria stiedai]
METILASRNGGIQANVPSLEGNSDFQILSTVKSRGIFGAKQRASQKSPQSGVFRCVFAASVVSLILVYVLLSCFQHVSFVPKVRPATRSLAAGVSDGGFCSDLPDTEDTEQVHTYDDEGQEGASGAGGQRAAVGAAQVPIVQQGGASNPLDLPESGRGPRQMPPQWMGRATGLLYTVKQLKSTYVALFPLLDPPHAVKLCERLMLLAAIELTGLAYAPSVLQPLISEVAVECSSMVELVQSHRTAKKAARQMRMYKGLQNLKLLLGAIADLPTENVPFQNYRATMTVFLNTATYAITQAFAQLELLLPQQQDQGTRDPQIVLKALRVLLAIYTARRAQLLQTESLRERLSACQGAIRAAIIKTAKEAEDDARNLEQQQVLPVEQVVNAIVAAGGTPVASALTPLYVDPQPPSHYSTVFSAAPTDEANFPPQDSQHYHPRPPAFRLPVPPPAGLEPLELPNQPSGPDKLLTSLQPQTEGQTSQQLSRTTYQEAFPHIAPSFRVPQLPQQGAASHWEQLGARPRQQVALVSESRAQKLGWGYRRMPADWLNKFRELLELMRTAATTCGSLLPSLSPIHAGWLSMHLSTLATVEISALAYLPADLQPLRQAVGASYRQLLERVLTVEPTQSAAAKKGLTTRISSLQVALERLSGVPPDIESSPSEYMRRICIQYRVCKYAFSQVLSLFEGLIPSPQPSGRVTVEPEAVVKAVSSMVYSCKMHLLVDRLLRGWFVSETSNLEYPLCTPEDLTKASQRTPLATMPFVKRLRSLLSKVGVKSIDLEKGDSPYDGEFQSTEPNIGEPFSAGVMGPGPQASQQMQPAPPASQSLSGPPEYQLPSSQPACTRVFSAQPPAQPDPSLWSTVATSHFGVPHSSLWTWSLDKQQQGPQQPPQTHFGSPVFVLSVHSSGSPDGGVSGSWDDEKVQGSSGAAAGELGLLDLAARVSHWDMSKPKDGKQLQGSSGGVGGELGLLDLADRVSQFDVSDPGEDDEDD